MQPCPRCGGALLELKRLWMRMPHFQCSNCATVWVHEGGQLEPCLQPEQHLKESLEAKPGSVSKSRKGWDTRRKGGKS
jgi:hypothetical protein